MDIGPIPEIVPKANMSTSSYESDDPESETDMLDVMAGYDESIPPVLQPAADSVSLSDEIPSKSKFKSKTSSEVAPSSLDAVVYNHELRIRRVQKHQMKRLEVFNEFKIRQGRTTLKLREEIRTMQEELKGMREQVQEVESLRTQLFDCEQRSILIQEDYTALRDVVRQVCNRIDRMEMKNPFKPERCNQRQRQRQRQQRKQPVKKQITKTPAPAAGENSPETRVGLRLQTTCSHCRKTILKTNLHRHVSRYCKKRTRLTTSLIESSH